MASIATQPTDLLRQALMNSRQLKKPVFGRWALDDVFVGGQLVTLRMGRKDPTVEICWTYVYIYIYTQLYTYVHTRTDL